EAWRAGSTPRAIALSLAAIYTGMQLPTTMATERWSHDISIRVRGLVEGVESAHAQHPKQSILLEGVDTELFWNGILDRPFRLFGLDHVYLTPGSERHIEAHPGLGDAGEHILPA